MADRFMGLNYYADCSKEQVSKVFGTQFSESLFKLNAGSWRGPVESGLGSRHLVWVEAVTTGRVPAFDEVDPSQVKSEWMADQRAESKRRAFDVLKARYQIVLPGLSPADKPQ